MKDRIGVFRSGNKCFGKLTDGDDKEKQSTKDGGHLRSCFRLTKEEVPPHNLIRLSDATLGSTRDPFRPSLEGKIHSKYQTRT